MNDFPLTTLTIGCSLRVVSQVLAYQGWADEAWRILPVSALIEMAAVTVFAVNMSVTFLSRKRLAQVSPAAIAFGMRNAGAVRS